MIRVSSWLPLLVADLSARHPTMPFNNNDTYGGQGKAAGRPAALLRENRVRCRISLADKIKSLS
jgi:hypothetical protein